MPEAPAYYDRAEYFRRAREPRPRRHGGRPRQLARRCAGLAGARAAAPERHHDLQPSSRGSRSCDTIAAMSPTEQQDPAWRYWKARALQVTALDGRERRAAAADARLALAHAAARERWPPRCTSTARSPPRTSAGRCGCRRRRHRSAPRSVAVRWPIPGSTRALQLIGIGLRSEGVREWNFTLRGMPERDLLAAAQLACDREVWDRCINTSEKTVGEIDIAQRYPMPFRNEVVAQTRETGIDPAYVYGLIRQESRFIMNARSHVGASGLMQLMPATARWTARKIGLTYSGEQIDDRATNLLLGTTYLKLVLDEADGQQALGAAAYNAGPGRMRRWREGPPLEPAVWAETHPVQRDARLCEEGAVERAVLCGAARHRGADDAPPSRAAGRLARSGLARPGTCHDHAAADRSHTRARRHRLRRARMSASGWSSAAAVAAGRSRCRAGARSAPAIFARCRRSCCRAADLSRRCGAAPAGRRPRCGHQPDRHPAWRRAAASRQSTSTCRGAWPPPAVRTACARLIHVSALGVSPDAPSAYLRSKAAGEAVLKEAGARTDAAAAVGDVRRQRTASSTCSHRCSAARR